MWLAASGLLVVIHVGERPRPGARHFAADSPASIARAVLVMAIETGLLYAVLRPWSYRRSAGRAFAAFGLFVLWTLLSMFGVMHASNAALLHLLWLAAVDLLLLVCGLISVIGGRSLDGARVTPRGT
jgi:hypothetical protein